MESAGPAPPAAPLNAAAPDSPKIAEPSIFIHSLPASGPAGCGSMS